jgi:aldehyde dehydrogenase (NAD+)
MIKRIDEAFERISTAPHPLSAFIFSRNQSAIDRFVGELSFGAWRCKSGQHPRVRRDNAVRRSRISGNGHYYGKYGFDMLTHAKSIVSPPDVAIEHLFPPYSPKKNAATDNRRKWSW